MEQPYLGHPETKPPSALKAFFYVIEMRVARRRIVSLQRAPFFNDATDICVHLKRITSQSVQRNAILKILLLFLKQQLKLGLGH